MASYPYARVAHLLGIDRETLPPYMTCPYSHASTTTPRTITGSDRAISSYDLTIAYRDRTADAWLIYDHPNSPTTNRHIRTVIAVLESQGYTRTDETKTLAQGWGKHATYRIYRREGA